MSLIYSVSVIYPCDGTAEFSAWFLQSSLLSYCHPSEIIVILICCSRNILSTVVLLNFSFFWNFIFFDKQKVQKNSIYLKFKSFVTCLLSL